jgi:hypothetical protein
VVTDLEKDDTIAIAHTCNLEEAAVYKLAARTFNNVPQKNGACFFCKEVGHFKRDCPKLRRRSGRPNRFNDDREKPRGSPLSSVFGKSNRFNGKKGYTRLERPRKQFRTFIKSRGPSTGGGYKIQEVKTEADVDALPEDAEVFFLAAESTKYDEGNMYFFDLA